MSWEALTWASNEKMKLGSPTARGLLILLANYADEEGKCFPSHEKLQKVTEFSARAVQLNMNKLEEWGLIERKRERNDDGTLGRTRYRLCLEKNPATICAGHKHDVPVAENDCPPAPDAGGPPARGAGQDNHHEDNHQSTPIAPKGAVGEETSSGEEDQLYAEFIRRYAAPPTASALTPRRHWNKLSDVDRRKAIDAIVPYRAACAAEKPKPRKMLDPSAYLARRIFDNFTTSLKPRTPDSPAVAALRRALEPNFSAGVMVELGTPEWAEWQAVAEEAGFPLRAIEYPARPFAGRPNKVTGRLLPSAWPPSRDGPDRRQQAAGER